MGGGIMSLPLSPFFMMRQLDIEAVLRDASPRAQLLHLNAAHRRILIGVEIVGAPVVGEPERTIELRRRQTAMIPDIQSRDVASAGDGDVPTIAVVDHTLRWGTGRDALEIAPHRDAPRNA